MGAQNEFRTPSYGKKLEFGAAKDAGSERACQGRDHDFKGLDGLLIFSLAV